ncbi:MAG: hypothetical protein P8J78_11660, partial [Maricaulis sp.]|nr:hypothetical protein [Maricaulis sp.]
MMIAAPAPQALYRAALAKPGFQSTVVRSITAAGRRPMSIVPRQRLWDTFEQLNIGGFLVHH